MSEELEKTPVKQPVLEVGMGMWEVKFEKEKKRIVRKQGEGFACDCDFGGGVCPHAHAVNSFVRQQKKELEEEYGM